MKSIIGTTTEVNGKKFRVETDGDGNPIFKRIGAICKDHQRNYILKLEIAPECLEVEGPDCIAEDPEYADAFAQGGEAFKNFIESKFRTPELFLNDWMFISQLSWSDLEFKIERKKGV